MKRSTKRGLFPSTIWNDPNYKPTTAEVGVETSSEAPTFDNPKTAEVETNPAPAGTSRSHPRCWRTGERDDRSVTGVVTMKPTVEQANKTFSHPGCGDLPEQRRR